jgi:hypothetical protein
MVIASGVNDVKETEDGMTVTSSKDAQATRTSSLDAGATGKDIRN